jgi:hypothetical protein
MVPGVRHYPRDQGAIRPVAVLALLAGLSFLVTGCGGGPAHSSVADIGNGKTTPTQAGSATGSSSSGQSGPTDSGFQLQISPLLRWAEWAELR